VSTLGEKLQNTANEMLKELEGDKAAGRYIVWLRFASGFRWKDCRKENVVEFLKGEFLHLLLFFLTVCMQSLIYQCQSTDG